jgi:enterochelin esterase-like enzyme
MGVIYKYRLGDNFKSVCPAVSVLILALAPVCAQAPGGGPATPRIVSPEVLTDRRVTFRLFAPAAKDVQLHFERGGSPMQKGTDGVWSVTMAPMEAGSYRYGFSVDGANVTDPRNIETERMQVLARSIVHIPGAAFMDERAVPHGAVSVVTYHSKTLGKIRRLHVYTPPGYESNQQRYPVLYLLHGANESDESWSTVGRAGVILDNLVAEGKALPMIVVMPNGHADQTPPVIFGPVSAGAQPPLHVELTDIPKEFAADIVPGIDARYRTLADRAHRAIAGLSMGGTQTLFTAMDTLEWFSAVGVFSSGILGGTVAEWEQDHLAALHNTGKRNGLKTMWFRTGADDFLLPTTQSTVEMMRKHGFDVTFEKTSGSHSWVNWRNYLHDFAPLLFR